MTNFKNLKDDFKKRFCTKYYAYEKIILLKIKDII